jgi:protoporphyrinogen oxidase
MNSEETIDVVILGSGIAGLAAAHRACELGLHAVIFEARDSAGGLLDNFEVNGFRFDHAVHLSFATEPLVRKVFDKTPYFKHQPEAKCFELNKWLKHPVQNNLFPLDAHEKVGLLKSFIERNPALTPTNYEMWLKAQYGEAIAERYPIKYTNKYWCTPALELSTNWVKDRMRRASVEEVLYGAMTHETPNHYYVKEMRYPKEGGFKAFIQPLISKAEIHYKQECVVVDPEKKTVTFKTGIKIRYKKLISSLPLPELISLLNNVPGQIKEIGKSLVATSIDLISVGFNSKIKSALWFYIYDQDIYASRAYSPTEKSINNAPAGSSSLQFEIYNRGPDSKYTSAQLAENTLYAIKKMGLGSDKDILFMDHRRIRYGNVIYELGMESRRDLIRQYLNEIGIKAIGRFGEWGYLWSNDSFLSGYSSLNQ